MSLRYGNGRLSESYQVCPYPVTSALHSLSGTFIHVSSTSIESQAGLDGMTLWLSFGSSELGLVLPLCALVTIVLRLVGFDNPCRLGAEMVALVSVIRLVHVLLPVPYTPRVARVR